MLTIQFLSSVLLLSASVFAQEAEHKPCTKGAAQMRNNRQFHKVVRGSGRPHFDWEKWNNFTKTFSMPTRPTRTASAVASSVEEDASSTYIEVPVFESEGSAPEADAPATRSFRPRPTSSKKEEPKTTSVKPKPTSVRPKPTTAKPKTTTTRPAPTSAVPEPSATSPATGNLSDFARIAVTEHNKERALHGADPLEWDDKMAAEAQKWTDRCVWEHGGGKSTGSGENLAMGADMARSVKMWADEKSLYKQGDGFSSGAGHFTQLVWKGSKKIGCASSPCTGKAGMYSPFISCIYYPPGNYQGQFNENVQAVPNA